MTFKPKHVLVPVAVGAGDDIALAEQLVDSACDVARHSGDAARVTLVYVNTHKTLAVDAGFAPPSYYEAMAKAWEENHVAAAAVLAKLCARAEAAGVSASSSVLEPTTGAGEAIAAAAREGGADLIALLSHGRRGLQRIFLGSVAERVAHLATVPVLILRIP